MIEIKTNEAAAVAEVTAFFKNIDFGIPKEFISFFTSHNGALIDGENNGEFVHIRLYSLAEMIMSNQGYKWDEFAPGYFLFGTDEGGTAYFLEKETGYVYEREFIAMPEDAILICKSFSEFLQKPYRA